MEARRLDGDDACVAEKDAALDAADFKVPILRGR